MAGRGQDLHDIRGLSPAGSACQAILGTVRSLVTPTPHGHWFSAGVVSDGSYGVRRGLVFSLPIRTEDGLTWSIVQRHYLDDHAQARIAETAAALEDEAVIVNQFL